LSDATRAGPATESRGAGFWVPAVVGIGIMAFGAKGLLDAAPATRPNEVLFGGLGLDVLHDALLAPLACAIGLVLARFLPRWLRAPVRAGLFASGIVIIVGWAGLRGYGRDSVPDNHTVDPLHYGTAVLTVLGAAWIAVAIWSALRWRRSRRAREPGVVPGPDGHHAPARTR
jgi:hypothetical protein